VTGRSLAAVIRAAGGPPGTAAAAGPLGRYLTGPGAVAAHVARVLLEAARHQGPVAGPVLAAALITVAAARRWLRRRQHAALAADARVITVLAPPLADPAGGQALWGHLTGLLRPPWARLWHGQPHIGFEYAWAGPVMTISVWVPGIVPPGMIERAIEAAWPGAHAITAPAAPPFPPGALATGGTLRLARTEVLPLKTDHEADPLRALAAAGSGLAGGEHAIVQVLARPVTGARLRRARRAARQLRTGRPARLSSRLLDAFTPGHPGPAGRAAARSDPELAAEIRASVIKSAGPQWDTQIRYATATTAVPAARGRLRDKAARARARARLRGLAHGLASATALYAGRNWLARRHLRHPAAQIAARRFRRGGLLSVPELAAIARLPADPSLPGLGRAGARAIAPPPAVPAPGPDARPLGVSDTGVPRAVGIAVSDARHHLRVIGPTGTGKTTLITGQILADAGAGRGVVFVDPKGDAVTDLLARLPAEAAGKVVLLDPADKAAPPCLNVLQGDGSGTDHDVITDNVTGIFRRIFSQFWGPRTDDIFRAACLTLLQSVPPGSGQVTLADIPALLTEDAYRRRLTAGIRDPVLAGFWTWYEQLSDASKAHAIGPLMNKLRAFLLRSFARQAIAAGPSTFTMTGVLDHGGLCLARLPKGTLGEETAQLVGSFLVAATWQAASRRADSPQHQRADAGLYIDECQNFLNLPYPLEDLLAEARAYRLAITMAHQNLAQLPPDLAAGISANARSQVIFTASPEDARVLERHTLPNLTAHDLSHLGAYQAAARLVVGGGETPAFTFRTRPLPPAVPGRAAMIRAAARAAYSGSAARTAAPPGPRGGSDPRLHIPRHHRPRDPRRSPMPAGSALTTGPRRPMRPARTSGRLARSPSLAAALAARLTARDRWLLRMLHEHRVLTTTQITQLAFGTTRAATARLLTLYQLRAIDRFRPLAATGSAPLHFVLDEAGACLLAAEDGITPGQLGYRRDRALAIALSAQLTHAAGANSVFCALAAQGRRAGNAALTCWWSERRCAALWGDLARPDGYGQWTEHAPGGPVTTDFFLEYDTGSENLHRVAAKLPGYRDLAARTGITTPVLFWLPTARREAGLRALLASTAGRSSPGARPAGAFPGVPVATTTPEAAGRDAGPAGPIWLPAGQPGPRLRLTQAGGPAPAPHPATAPGGQAEDSTPPGTGLPWHPPAPAPPPPPGCHASGPGTRQRRQHDD